MKMKQPQKAKLTSKGTDKGKQYFTFVIKSSSCWPSITTLPPTIYDIENDFVIQHDLEDSPINPDLLRKLNPSLVFRGDLIVYP